MAMKEKHLRRIVEDLERQGARVRTTGEGWLIQFPDGSGTTLHKTQSDHRAWKNFRSVVRRAGFEFPSWGTH